MAVADSLIPGETDRLRVEEALDGADPRVAVGGPDGDRGAAHPRRSRRAATGSSAGSAACSTSIAVGLFLAGIGWIIYNVVAWRTAEFAVTNMRVLREEGLASQRSSTTLLSSLSDVKSNVGVVGGQIGYGDIVLLTQSGGAGVDRFMTITHPIEFRNAVMTQKMAEPPRRPVPRRHAAVAPAAAPVAPAAPPRPGRRRDAPAPRRTS